MPTLAPARGGERTDTNRAYPSPLSWRGVGGEAVVAFAVIGFLFFGVANASAQHLAGRAIAVDNMSVNNDGRNLVVDMDLRLDSLRMPSNRRLVFTPMVESPAGRASMPQIVINGRRQDIVYKRSAYRDFDESTVVVRRDNGTPQTVHYNAVLPYEQWMKNSDLTMREDLCGCGDTLDRSSTLLYPMRTPVMAYIKPQSAVKEREEKGIAFIDFPVDKIVLYPDYRNNPRELDKIIATINLVKEDKNVTITGIEIHGYASPESPYSHNAYLAASRAETLKDYVRRQLALDDRLFTVSSTPEDWQGLRDYVAGSNLDNRDAILALINDSSLDPDVKERRIKTQYPQDYRFMLDTWYPALRHSDYVVHYTVRPFTVEEARELLYTKPQQLSLEEMYLVAQTYEAGSDEFNEVFAIAVRMYPDDPVANLNAACTEIERNDYAAAGRYLAKAGNTPHVTHARAVIAMKQGRTADAITLFQEAKAGGVPEAEENLRLLGNPS